MTPFLILLAAVIFAIAAERLIRRIAQIPALVRQGCREARDHGSAVFEAGVSARVGMLLVPVERNAALLRQELAAAEGRRLAAAADTGRLLLDLRRLLVLAQAPAPAPLALPPPPPLPSTVPPPGPGLHALDTVRPLGEAEEVSNDGDRPTSEEMTQVVDLGDRAAGLPPVGRRLILRLPMPARAPGDGR